MQFGKPVREKYFSLLDPKLTPINHGSYGLTPVPVYNEFIRLIREDYAFPDKYMIDTQGTEYLNAVKTVGEIVKCDYHNIAMIDNATSGINTIFRSKDWKKTDKVLITSVVYDSCEHALRYLQRTFGFDIIKIDLNVEKDVFQQFKQAIEENPDINMVMFDLVSSMPAFLFPYKELVEYFNSKNIISVIDGAHGVGLTPLDLGELDPDYFVSNLHKWYYCPRPLAFMYVKTKHFKEIQPMPISHFYDTEDVDEDTLIKKFKFLASKNYAYYNCVGAAKKFRENWGDEKIWSYCESLKKEVITWLTKRWGTKQLGNDVIQMANIEIPGKFSIPRETTEIFKKDMSKTGDYAQVGYYKDKFLIRLSFQIYNDFEDYVKAIEALEPLLLDYQKKSKF